MAQRRVKTTSLMSRWSSKLSKDGSRGRSPSISKENGLLEGERPREPQKDIGCDIYHRIRLSALRQLL